MATHLTEALRPKKMDDFVGQDHLLNPQTLLRQAIEGGNIHSMVLWGPPGTGKTSLARMLADYSQAHFTALSAVLDNLAAVRQSVQEAKARQPQKTILFIDEVHRFNKAQQDAFLPHIEDATVIFIGATTNNPSFELNPALLSRLKLYVFKPIDEAALLKLVDKGWQYLQTRAKQSIQLPDQIAALVSRYANQDARRLLATLELLFEQAVAHNQSTIDESMLAEAFAEPVPSFDKRGDYWYDQISALHKSIRGSSPDAAIYWFCRMVEAGCDPLYIARRLLAIASEDVGNADVNALPLALAAWQTYQRLGQYEGERAIAQACIYLACAPKSNAVDQALKKAKKFVQQAPSYEVPMHLRNAPTELMQKQGFGKGYRYAHEEEEAYAAGESYLPEAMADRVFYQPSERGLEKKIADKLDYLRQLDKASPKQRYK